MIGTSDTGPGVRSPCFGDLKAQESTERTGVRGVKIEAVQRSDKRRVFIEQILNRQACSYVVEPRVAEPIGTVIGEREIDRSPGVDLSTDKVPVVVRIVHGGKDRDPILRPGQSPSEPQVDRSKQGIDFLVQRI